MNHRSVVFLARMTGIVCVLALAIVLGLAAADASLADSHWPGELLMTEVIVTPTDGEFVEIYNPTDAAIDLSNVYFTDGTFANGGVFYYNIVTGSNAGGGGFGDFHARFPAGASIGPGEYQTVSLAGSDGFMAEFGVEPTYELYEDGAAPDAVPDMLEALPGSINNQGGFSNSGEVAILYHWDGTTDLVQDLDYFIWGDLAEAVDKTGVAIDGPDADDGTSNYLPDSAADDQEGVAPGSHEFGDSWQRKDLDEGAEVQEGGNGIAGDNEMSENLSTTWCNGAPTPNAATECAAPPPPPSLKLRIHEIQGAGHVSPYVDEVVAEVPGIVTVARSFGFYMQDSDPDNDIATSEGIFVLSSSDVAVGDSVVVTGTVTEYYPGGEGSGNLSTTELIDATADVLSSGNALPPATVLGNGGRVPPASVIDDDATGDVNTSGSFDAAADGIDFYESLEGMRVQVNDAVAVGPTSRFGEIPVVGDNGANAAARSLYGGAVIQPGDFNPERILVDDTLIRSEPKVSTGAKFGEPIVGVLDYSFGNFKLFNSEPLVVAAAGIENQEVTKASKYSELKVATFNVLNLDPGDRAAKFENLAKEIVVNLNTPDIIGLQEIQDNTGGDDDGVVDAGQTYAALIAAISAVGGPTYDYRDIAPINNADGGAPGSNIRVGFLFNPDRVSFVDRPGGDATTANAVQLTPGGPVLSLSPGRIAPTDPAWADNPDTGFQASRKSLAGEFTFNGHRLFVIVNHFKSKGGDNALFGRAQPPVFVTETQRVQQAALVNAFVDEILAANPRANVIVLGDMNDFDFSASLTALKGDALTNVIDLLPLEERYTYIFDGNSQVLDNLLMSSHLYSKHFVKGDVVHVNADFPDINNRASDHDPVLATFDFPVWRFRGYVYEGQIGDRTQPKGGITLSLYGRNAGDPAPGVLLKTQTSQLSGFFNFFVIQPWNYDHYRLVSSVSNGVQTPDGTIVDLKTVDWMSATPTVHTAEYWIN